MKADRFGNVYAPGLPYARGALISSTQDDIVKLRTAWGFIRQRVTDHGLDGVFNLSGLERGFKADLQDECLLDDEIAPALCVERLTELGLEHLGGSPEQHDIMVMNRQTGALLASTLVMVQPGETVIGVSPSHSHPGVIRAAARAGANFTDTTGVEQFRTTLAGAQKVSLVVLTRLAVTYDILSTKEMERIVALAKDAKARILVDDAGGARVGPAVFDQPKALQLGVDVVTTGLDKYGTVGPRLGLLGGNREIVDQIRACAFELGLEARPMLYPAVVQSLEQYRPARVRELIDTTKTVTQELKALLGNRVVETPVIAQLLADDILEMAMERRGLSSAPIVPLEATAALAMYLVRDHGILTVHFAGIPPGTSAFLIKFLPPETIERFGGARKFALAIDGAIDCVAEIVDKPDAVRELLFGHAATMTSATNTVVRSA